MQSLHGPIFHRGDAQRSKFPIGFRDVDAPQGLGLVPAPPQRSDGSMLGSRRLPDFSVDSGSPFALIFRHPPHGQSFAVERVGQQPLQGFRLVVSAFPCCLDDTRLQPPDFTLTTGPVDPVPR